MTDGLAQWGREADISKPEPIPELRNFQVWTPEGPRDVTSAFRQYQALMEKLERMARRRPAALAGGDRPVLPQPARRGGPDLHVADHPADVTSSRRSPACAGSGAGSTG